MEAGCMLKKIKNRIQAVIKPKNGKRFNSDKWLTKNFEKLVDKYAGRYILVVDGRVLYSDKDGSPREIADKAKSRFPHAIPLFLRIPRPKDFLCALNAE
jgi:Ni,Fe-hydrogenase I small subunit